MNNPKNGASQTRSRRPSEGSTLEEQCKTPLQELPREASFNWMLCEAPLEELHEALHEKLCKLPLNRASNNTLEKPHKAPLEELSREAAPHEAL